MNIVGLTLGILIGIITGIVLLLLLNLAVVPSNQLQKIIIPLIAEFFAIPTFWFGGPWLTTTLLKFVDLNDILPSYLLSLSVTFFLICIIPLFRLIINIGNKIGQQVVSNGG